MPPVQINITTKLNTNNKFLKQILSGLAGQVNDQVTEFIEEQSKEMAGGAVIFNVPESARQKDKIETPTYLSDTISSKKTNETKYSASSTVKAKAQHASWVEWGTGLYGELLAPHFIYPKKGKVMTWIGKNGERIFAARTSGQYPKPFMRGSIYKLKAMIGKVLRIDIK